jgi:RNA polymerase sigma-70 factor, ECF subfamily
MATRTPMSRDTTYTDLARAGVTQASAEFVMDEAAFRGFYERTARGVWAYLARITGNRELADDLLQETYYRFLRAAATHENETHRRNSLYRIAGNLALDARRRSLARLPFQHHSAGIEQVPGRDPTRRHELASDLERCLDQMKPRERALLWLAYAEGASHQEISGTLGIAVGSLKVLLFRARRKLAALMSGGKAAPR